MWRTYNSEGTENRVEKAHGVRISTEIHEWGDE